MRLCEIHIIDHILCVSVHALARARESAAVCALTFVLACVCACVRVCTCVLVCAHERTHFGGCALRTILRRANHLACAKWIVFHFAFGRRVVSTAYFVTKRARLRISSAHTGDQDTSPHIVHLLPYCLWR